MRRTSPIQALGLTLALFAGCDQLGETQHQNCDTSSVQSPDPDPSSDGNPDAGTTMGTSTRRQGATTGKPAWTRIHQA
jgi:hypothetical protein